MIETNEDIRLIKEGTILEVMRDDKNKIGGWLNRQSQIPKDSLNEETKNMMEWEKAIFILLWNARVKELNLILNNSPSMKKLVVYYYVNTNKTIEETNNKIIIKNKLLQEILKDICKSETFDLAFTYRKIICNEEIRKVPAPAIKPLMSLFEIIPDFVF